MKKAKRVFNFNLPDDLREYLKDMADKKSTTISQYIIDLIVENKEKNIIESRVIQRLKSVVSEHKIEKMKQDGSLTGCISEEYFNAKKEL